MFKKDYYKTISFLWKFIAKYKWSFLTVVALTVIGDQFTLIVTNMILKNFINEASNGMLSLKRGIIYGVSYLISFNLIVMLFFPMRKIKFPMMFKLKEDIKNFIFQHSLRQSNSFFSENFVGSLNSKINDITGGMEKIVEKSFDIISNFIAFAVLGFIFFKTYWVMGALFFCSFVVYGAAFFVVSKRIEKSSEETSKKENECSGKIIDCFSNILNIKIFSTEKIEKANIKKQTLLILKNASRVQLLRSYLDLLNLIYRLFLLGSVFFISLYLLLNHRIGVGDLIANVSLVGSIFYWLYFAITCLMDSIEAFGKINQAVQTLFVNPEIVDSKNAKKLVMDKAEIDFKNVEFRYNADLPNVFENLNLKINSHEKIGLVGYSGSGKSTLIGLLLRFYDTTGGEVLIDNQNIKDDITQASLRSNISYIPQDPILFHRTIRENIIYGKLNATDDEIIEATKKACCYDFIKDLENGFDTLVGERGVKLSGGQRQRIAIARAILKNSPILILDEATSALDSITEKEIQAALKNLMENKTVIAVAHRLSTLNNMDRIIVLDKGKIVEDGTKDELLSIKDGLFAKMWNMQKDGVIGN